ncbi:MAG TPA: CMP-N-acetylneuraminic acid synthetase [Rhodospirillales bacterium]|nr:CMP-N-acetylneuraminic acid synthetase [Rhodospirillales bacterium]
MNEAKTILLGNRKIGIGNPSFIIAEGCDNHMGDMGVAHEMISQAKLAGADAVKFQHHLPDAEMLPDAPMSDNFDEPLYEFLKKNALSLDDHSELKKHCEDIGIQYMCTPFSWAAAEEIESIGVDAYKIGSGEMTDIPTLSRIAAFGKPMIISTGMSTFEEIDRTYNTLCATGAPIALMNCVSEYPPDYQDMNLGVIEALIARYPNAVIGHSDHTPDLFTCFAALTLGAALIEKHVILDKCTAGPDQSVSIDFHNLTQLVDGIRKIEAAMGTTKAIHDKERQIRTWAFHSIVSMRRIEAGEVIDREMIWSKRPGTGIPAHRMPEVIGRKSCRAIEANSLLSWDDMDPV